MPKIKVNSVANAEWFRGKDEGAAAEFRVHIEGDQAIPQLFEVKLGPDVHQALHAHDEDEIIYVVSGSMRVGPRTLLPGSSVFVAGKTFYQFTCGPEGLQYLNFRPRKDMSYHLPEAKKDRNT